MFLHFAITRKKMASLIGLLTIFISVFLIVEFFTTFTNRQIFQFYPAIREIPYRPVPDMMSIERQLPSASSNPIQTPFGRKYAIISINVNSGIYFFHLPIVLLSWRRVGFEPLFVIVHSEKQKFDSFTKLTLSFLNQLDAKIVFLISADSYEVTTAMIAREMSGVVSEDILKDYDYVITSDSDLYPIDYTYYTNLNDGSIRVWNADCCGLFEYEHRSYSMFPMGKKFET